MQVEQNFSLKNFNTFQISAIAKYFVLLDASDQQLLRLLSDEKFHHLPRLVLGEGSNILLVQDFEGLVLKMATQGIKKIKENREYIWLSVAAGENWDGFVSYCVKRGYGGVENLFLIPSSVGGAVVQNIGAYGSEISEVVESVRTINQASYSSREFDSSECEFGYRKSHFKKEENPYIVTNVTFRLRKSPHFKLDYQPLYDHLKNEKVITLKKVMSSIAQIRQARLPNYMKFGNAGSFFKNPVISLEQFNLLASHYPQTPHWKEKERFKISAAYLIEHCGFKGKRVGNVGVSKDHALCLINYGNASGQEIQNLAFLIQQTVFQKFGVMLEKEIVVV